MSFNLDPSKQTQEVIFSRKSNMSLNVSNVSKIFSQKYLGVILDFKLNIQDHLNNVLATLNKTIDLSRKLQTLLPRTTPIAYTNLSLDPI